MNRLAAILPEGLRRHVVDEIDDAVFQATGVEAVDDVHDQGGVRS